jgi:CRP-like cAMP-binding protein
VILENGSKNCQDDKVDVLRKSPSLAHLEDAAINELALISFQRSVIKGEFVFLEGDPSLSHLYIVQSGKIKLFKETLCGKIHTFNIARYGDTLHGIVLFTGKPCWMSAQAMNEGLLLCLEKKSFLSFVTQHPSILMKIVEILDNQISTTHSRLMEFVSADVQQRLLNVLGMLHARFGQTLFFTNEELAELAGTTTATTIRIMGRLKKSGLLDTRRGEIRILDKKQLNDLKSPLIIV